MTEGLSDRQKELVIQAAAMALAELLAEHPEVAEAPAGVVSTVFLAGVGAGVDALDRVLKVGLENWTP